MTQYLPFLIVWLAVLATFVFAVLKGGIAERFAATLVVIGALYAFGVGRLLDNEMRTLALLLGDFLLAMGFLTLAVRYASLWLGGAMLLQAVQFTLHAWYMLGERRPDMFHVIVNNADTVGILLCIVLGTATAWRRRGERQTTAGAAAPEAG
ncbi:hypothetical protein [Caulobacter sp. NIBR1757]|uniref:hypothetical protein n=1 Tax=Caulobacter sp. NIBR1757 TaxID=3016000 RepID=UPI0022F120B9|nr:hypothetical protein [Caulobacter sp. NIBR1757]WGM41229.1 hypothetical protein AMEJIAPC_04179 [Caulobacter sp. NIBR1757]